jgi:hypothetical protein
VVLLPDFDLPGKSYASAVNGLLARLDPRPTVRCLTLDQIWKTDAPIPEGGDAVEWLAEGVPELWTDAMCKEALELQVALAPVLAPERIIEDHGAVIQCLADVESRAQEWLWPGRMPIGSLTTIAGDPGLGKSFLTLDMAARVSRGHSWPDCPTWNVPVGSVILFSAEDPLDTTVIPRLDAALADRRRIFTMEIKGRKGELRPFSLNEIPALEQTILTAGDVRLVVIDPVTAFVGKTDDHKNAEVRGLLAPLVELAGRHRLAVVLVTHLNKNGTGRSLSRIMGSLAYTAAARSVWAVVRDRNDPQRRLLVPVKNNLAPDSTGLAYSIDQATMRVVWEPNPIHLHADEALSRDADTALPDPIELTRARKFLREFLGDRPLRANDVQAAAEVQEIARGTLRRAKRAERVATFKKDEGWWWRYPSPLDEGHRRQLDHLGHLQCEGRDQDRASRDQAGQVEQGDQDEQVSQDAAVRGETDARDDAPRGLVRGAFPGAPARQGPCDRLPGGEGGHDPLALA